MEGARVTSWVVKLPCRELEPYRCTTSAKFKAPEAIQTES